jgi:hypothetical protein
MDTLRPASNVGSCSMCLQIFELILSEGLLYQCTLNLQGPGTQTLPVLQGPYNTAMHRLVLVPDSSE